MIVQEFSMRRAQFQHFAEYLLNGDRSEENLDVRDTSPEDIQETLRCHLRSIVTENSISREVEADISEMVDSCVTDNQRIGFYIGLKAGAKVIIDLLDGVNIKL